MKSEDVKKIVELGFYPGFEDCNFIEDCFGHGFCSKESAYFGFNLSKKRYIEWKKKQCNLKNK